MKRGPSFVSRAPTEDELKRIPPSRCDICRKRQRRKYMGLWVVTTLLISFVLAPFVYRLFF